MNRRHRNISKGQCDSCRLGTLCDTALTGLIRIVLTLLAIVAIVKFALSAM